jgi:hypothetical protein
MAEKGFLSNTREVGVERSSEDIRKDIAKGEEELCQTVEEIGERIKEKLDWRGYVTDSPYLALMVAGSLGFLASKMVIRRTTPMERIMGSIANEVRDSLGDLHAGPAGTGLIEGTLLGIAAKVAVSWIKNATSKAVASGDGGPRP